MKRLLFLIFLIALAFNLFSFTVVLINNKSLSGKYINETEDTIIITVENILYKIDRNLVHFYLGNDEKIAVGKAKEGMGSQKVEYSKISDFIDITEKNYKQLTGTWQVYHIEEPKDLYLISLKNDNRFVGDLYFASADYLYLKHPRINKIYKIKKSSVIKIKFAKNDVTKEILDRYDGEENLISNEEEIVIVSSDNSPYPSYSHSSTYSKYRKNLIKKTRVFVSYVISSDHVLSHKDDRVNLSTTNGFQVSLEGLIKGEKEHAGYGAGISFMPYRRIKMSEIKPTYGFLPVYGLVYISLENKSFYSDLAIRYGIDFFFSNADYKGSLDSSPWFYFSPSYFVKMSNALIGFGYQINFGRLTTSETKDFILVKDSSFFISIGFMY